jgi:hypothetical protein
MEMFFTHTHLHLVNYVVGFVNQYMQVHEMTHIVSMKVILCYLHRYQSLNLYFVEGEENHLLGLF